MSRHQQRDQEAGGPGYGVLDTRKRAWRDSDGSVVEKRPRTDDSLTITTNTLPFENSGQVVSPPVSDEGRYSHGYEPARMHDQDDEPLCIDANEIFPVVPQTTTTPSISYGQPDTYFQSTPSSFSSRSQQPPRNEQVEYHPIFQPDTASSFNMPYTTALDYNWLFNLEAATASGFGMLSSGFAFQDQSSFSEQQAQEPRQAYQGVDLMQESDMAPVQQIQSYTPRSQDSSGHRSLADDSIQNTPRRREITPASSAPSSRWNNTDKRRTQPQSQGQRQSRRDSSRSTMQRQYRDHENISSASISGQYRHGTSHRAQHVERNANLERPLSMLQQPNSLPQIDEETHERLLSVIEMANPQIPDQPPGSSIRDHPSLSLSSLQHWLDLFFSQFNTTYPLIHTPTFDPATSEPLLLLSTLLLGATYSDKAAHQLAVCIHDVIRPSIFAHGGFSPSPELWTLQTTLLVECFGKSRAGQKQHDMSHLFHGLLINLIRRSDCQSVTKVPTPPPSSSPDGNAAVLDETWRRWAEAEQKKRLALLCFMWDTQHAVLFCQSLCMSAFELRCAMPCSQGTWEAEDATRWAAAWDMNSSSPSHQGRATEPAMFLPALKSYLTLRPGDTISNEKSSSNNNLDALGLVLVLHGIMSIAWDMQRRDQTSLGVGSTLGVSSWRDLIGRAYDKWKVDFDLYCRRAVDSARGGQGEKGDSGEGALYCAEWLSFAAAYRTVYHAAQALLHTEFLDVQIYAGARHILGRPVQQRDYARSAKVVRRWASGGSGSRERAAVAAWHAAAMLRDVVVVAGKGKGKAATDTNLFHVPWCVYIATLTCWAFHHARPARRDRGSGRGAKDRGDDEDSLDEESDDSDEIVWDSNQEMEALVSEMAGPGDAQAAMGDLLAGQGRKRTSGLVWVVADLLSKVRWGIVHGGVVVLRGLVPMRLINQYDTI